MWAKFSSALKLTTSTQNAPNESSAQINQIPNLTQSYSQSQNQTESASRSLRQHSSISAFHNTNSHASTSSPPPSPSKRALFKRSLKEPDSVRSTSGSLKLLPKKIRGSLPFGNGNASQTSLASSTVETHQVTAERQSSKHKTHASQDTVRSFASMLRRPSLDILRSVTQESSHSRPSIDSPVDSKVGSVRSILRDPNTPGTGQNVRFFSHDAYKVISPDESTEENFLSAQQEQARLPEQASLMDRFNQVAPANHATTPVTRVSSPVHKSRPSLSGIFSPVESLIDKPEFDRLSRSSQGSMAMSLSDSISPPTADEANGSVEITERLELPSFHSGLGFDVDGSLLGSAIDLDFSVAAVDALGTQMTSTPCKPGSLANSREKEKEESIKSTKEEHDSIKEEEDESFKEEGDSEESDKKDTVRVGTVSPVSAPRSVDETIFHAKERPLVFSAPLHERSQSFSFGQTVFFSMGNNNKSPSTALLPAYPSNEGIRHSEDGPRAASPSTSGSRTRGRALSDTVFQSMLRAASPSSGKPSDALPEADINDESSRDLILFSSPTGEPDPFNARANTYYTPQTMIPTTPPAGVQTHSRKTSKEENLIYSLQAQLALQTELCSQFENDLHTKEEMIELLGKKVTDMEKQENLKKGALRQWKKKVQELERAIRMLEEEVDSSRQESMERSIMDEASGEALRMLHTQIAVLEREKKDWVKKEEILNVKVETLEALVKERSEDVMNLKETLWNKDESDRELDHGLREAKEQIDLLGNISLVKVDEEELKRLAQQEQQAYQQREAYRAAELEWEQEREELLMKLETIQVEKVNVEELLDTYKNHMKAREEEFEVIKNELEAQWGHTETASERIQELQKVQNSAESEVSSLRREREDAIYERDELAQKYEEMERRVGNFELEWNESENRKIELESELHQLWELKETLEKEREQLDAKLGRERDRSEGLDSTLHQCEDRIAELEQEQQSMTEDIARLKGDLRHRDEEISDYSQRTHAQELEAENLREEISKLRREHSRIVNEHARALEEATGLKDDARKQLQDFDRQKNEAETRLRSSEERMTSLKNEMDRLRKHAHELQQESADKEVKIVQLTKQREQDKEDIQGLNIALSAKQQELELYKRKTTVKTGAAVPSVPETTRRRGSTSTFDNTPSASRPPSRATSIVSDSGSAKSEGVKISTLGRSSRINALSSISTTGSTIKRAEGSLGLKSRASFSATPTPSARASTLTRPALAKAQAGSTPARRVSSGTNDKARLRPSITSPTPSISELGEKENMDAEAKAARRRSLIPAPV